MRTQAKLQRKMKSGPIFARVGRLGWAGGYIGFDGGQFAGLGTCDILL